VTRISPLATWRGAGSADERQAWCRAWLDSGFGALCCPDDDRSPRFRREATTWRFLVPSRNAEVVVAAGGGGLRCFGAGGMRSRTSGEKTLRCVIPVRQGFPPRRGGVSATT